MVMQKVLTVLLHNAIGITSLRSVVYV